MSMTNSRMVRNPYLNRDSAAVLRNFSPNQYVIFERYF